MTTTVKTMTAAQMRWAIGQGFAWPESAPDEDGHVHPEGDGLIFWTRSGAYHLDVMTGLYVLAS